MPLFGKKPTEPPRPGFKVVRRAAGDTAPLEPRIAEALRQAGMDPEQYTLAPAAGGDAPGPTIHGLPPRGSTLSHNFLLSDRAAALRCVDVFVDRRRPVTISLENDGWWVTINGADDPALKDADEHRQIAAEVVPLGGQDRGFVHTVVNTTFRGHIPRL